MQYNNVRPLNQLHWRKGLRIGKGPHFLRSPALYYLTEKNHVALCHISRTDNRIWSLRLAAS
jgi:hypothetical protein